MKWNKTERYQTSVRVGFRTYIVVCEKDFDNGFAVYVDRNFVADVDTLPTEEELKEIILDNNMLESNIKEGYASAGVFE
jgi:hypothetical protein